jgi:hypothetical protein
MSVTHNAHYHHGAMDIDQQLKTYNGFLVGSHWIALAAIVALTFAILAFCTSAGFFGAAAAALVEVGFGIWLVQERPRSDAVSEAAALFLSTGAECDHPVERAYQEELAAAAAEEHAEALAEINAV